MRLLRNQSGQSLIEATALALALTALLSAFAGVLYFGFVHSGMSYLMHEHLVCQQTQREVDCDGQFRKRSKAWLFKAEISSFQSTKGFGKIRDRLQLRMPMKRMMTITKEMELLP